MRAGWVLVLAGCVACVPEHLVECADGRLCPAGTVCEDKHETCVAAEQIAVCTGVADGVRCEAKDLAGLCDLGTCLPGCGDGMIAAGEDCDDGNFTSHDGCSSSCLRELPTWTQWQDPWRKRVAHVAGYDVAHDRVFVFGGHDGVSLIHDQWFRTNGVWTQQTTGLPPARRNAAMAYDSKRGVHVLFGGADGLSQTLGDTWEYDGTTWVPRQLPVSPTAREGHAMAFDPVRERIVLFGGGSVFTSRNDTWEYDGSTWIQASPANSPSPRGGAAMAWDPPSGKVVLFGGTLFFSSNETWAYDGDTWTSINTQGPSARGGARLAYFRPLNRLVLFGGHGNLTPSDTAWQLTSLGWVSLGTTGPPARGAGSLTSIPGDDPSADVLAVIGGDQHSSGPSNEVWELASSLTWAERPVPTSPVARITSIVYDDERGETLAFCGIGSALPHDTWAFRDGAWTNRGSPQVPHRFHHTLIYDPDKKRVRAFGGATLATQFDDLLEWDGTAWGTFQASPRPSVRILAGLAYDLTRKRLVMFGGLSSGVTQDDTWEQHGLLWEQTVSAVHPIAEAQPAMTYDPIGERVVLFSRDGTTWTYTSGTWSQLETTNAPPARKNGVLVFDSARRRLALYGGFDGNQFFDDLWELDGTTWSVTDVLGGGPPVRTSFGLAADRRARSLVLYGGVGLGTHFGDTWLLQHRSSTPDEQCANGLDDDGDNQVDVNDPDCN